MTAYSESEIQERAPGPIVLLQSEEALAGVLLEWCSIAGEHNARDQ